MIVGPDHPDHPVQQVLRGDPLPAAAHAKRLRHATRRRAEAQQAWREAIREAHAAGLSLRVIGESAGVAHTRVLQIVRERH